MQQEKKNCTWSQGSLDLSKKHLLSSFWTFYAFALLLSIIDGSSSDSGSF
jgi:hypothetical protein